MRTSRYRAWSLEMSPIEIAKHGGDARSTFDCRFQFWQDAIKHDQSDPKKSKLNNQKQTSHPDKPVLQSNARKGNVPIKLHRLHKRIDYPKHSHMIMGAACKTNLQRRMASYPPNQKCLKNIWKLRWPKGKLTLTPQTKHASREFPSEINVLTNRSNSVCGIVISPPGTVTTCAKRKNRIVISKPASTAIPRTYPMESKEKNSIANYNPTYQRRARAQWPMTDKAAFSSDCINKWKGKPQNLAHPHYISFVRIQSPKPNGNNSFKCGLLLPIEHCNCWGHFSLSTTFKTAFGKKQAHMHNLSTNDVSQCHVSVFH